MLTHDPPHEHIHVTLQRLTMTITNIPRDSATGRDGCGRLVKHVLSTGQSSFHDCCCESGARDSDASGLCTLAQRRDDRRVFLRVDTELEEENLH